MRKKQREDGIPFAIGFPAISEASVEIEPLSDNIEVVSGPQAIQLTTALPCELSKQVRQETTPPAKPFFGITLGFVKAPRNDDVVAATAAFETKAAAVTPDGIRRLNEEEGEKLTCVNAQPVRLNSPAISLANALNQYDPSDLSTARSVIDRCAGHELWNLMAALNKFHTFLPKSFFGGVPSGMDSVIAMFKKSQPTADVLLHLKTVAKTRAQVNGCILNTRNAKTIEAYQAINDFFEDGSAPASENTAIAALIKKLNNIAKPLPQPIAVRATA